jgi:hypothetical protein
LAANGGRIRVFFALIGMMSVEVLVVVVLVAFGPCLIVVELCHGFVLAVVEVRSFFAVLVVVIWRIVERWLKIAS